MTAAWPELPWRDWEPTVSTLHMWTQIVGKVRMALSPPLNHWWHITLYVTSRGLTTLAIPYGDRDFQVDFDFVEHRLRVSDSEAKLFTMPLEAMSVARFYRDFMAGLGDLGIKAHISTKPVEVAEAIPRSSRTRNTPRTTPHHANVLWRGFLAADRVMKEFQSGFVGKVSPVHLFWGSFDLAAARFSGRPAPLHSDAVVPNCPPWVMEEAYSREESSAGWWPSTDPPGPQFYAYTYPEPAGFSAASVRPSDAFYDPRLGEFTLPYEAVRRASHPDAAVLEFFQSTYEAGANLGGWDRAALEPAMLPGRPPNRPWSTVIDSAPGPGSRQLGLNRSKGWRRSRQ